MFGLNPFFSANVLTLGQPNTPPFLRTLQQQFCAKKMSGRTSTLADPGGKLPGMTFFRLGEPDKDLASLLVRLLFSQQAIELGRLDLPLPGFPQRPDDL